MFDLSLVTCLLHFEVQIRPAHASDALCYTTEAHNHLIFMSSDPLEAN